MATKRQLAQAISAISGGARDAAAELFGFSRATRLRDSFPQSQATILTPSFVSPHVNLTHPFAGELANYDGVAGYAITGAVGQPAVGSEIPAGFAFVGLATSCIHDDAAARSVLFSLQEVNNLRIVYLQSSAKEFDYNTGLVPGGLPWPVRPFIVPSGFRMRAEAIALGAGQIMEITGMGVVVPISEAAPTLWPR